MNPLRWSIALPLAAMLLVPFATPVAAVDVDVHLIAASIEFHVDLPTAPSDPTITVTVGDVIRFHVENQDSLFHTFTVPHFSVNSNLAIGAQIFVNITTTSADGGRWQFWCDPHSSGSTPETHAGMIGFIQVNSATPPPRQPGFEALVAVLAAGTAFAVLAVLRSRKKA